MIMKLLLAGAASAVIAAPVAAQEPGMSGTAATEPGAELAAPPASTTAPAKARTGAAADTSANVSDADLAIGASVKDSAGMELGKISKISKSAGQTVVTLSADGQTTQVPASSLMKSGGVLVSSDNKAEASPPK